MTTDQAPWTPPDPILVPVAGGSRFLSPMGRLDHFSGRWQRLRLLAPQQIEDLRTVATIESIGSSTRIEGARVTNEEVREILAGVSIDSFRSRDEQEVRGYRDLLELFFDQHEELVISENQIKEFHRILLAYSEKDRHHRGDYKTAPNHVEKRGDGSTVVVFRTAPVAETRWWMPRLVQEFAAAWDSPDWHRLALIADFVLWFLAIHPFQDGNGRLARALTTLLLLKAGYSYVPYSSLEGVIEENKARYYVALQTSQVATRSDPAAYGEWLGFFLGTLESQQQVLERRVRQLTVLQVLPPARSRVLALVTDRGPLTSSAVADALGIPERTARYHLSRLARDRLLAASTPTAGRLYSLPVEDTAAPTTVPAYVVADRPEAATATGGEKGLTTLDFDPLFQRLASSVPNGRAYASVVVGSAQPNSTPLGDAELDAAEALASRIAPTALAQTATPQVAWWRIDAAPHADKLQIWVHPGPILIVHCALDRSDAPESGRLALDPLGLVSYWQRILKSVPAFMRDLGVDMCALALNLQTQPSGRATIVDFDFSGTVTPVRSGTRDAVPPWRSTITRVAPEVLNEYHTLKPALDQLLRHFSYRHTGGTLEMTFAKAAAASWDWNDVPTRLVE